MRPENILCVVPDYVIMHLFCIFVLAASNTGAIYKEDDYKMQTHGRDVLYQQFTIGGKHCTVIVWY